ncbi:hypothetical protein GCM10022419_026330 [Nonomuraea rosea]|uniref:Bacterial transcriptional activator domain-containing protein n=1 Tax=Nonomuraea rosea TaxID=638574 RepID=A0ABP6W1V4_9ACTN
MGDSLTLLLLGPPDLAVGGAPVGIRSAKTRALLCYLAATPGPRPRAELAGLLWGERPDANARGSLRLSLSELRGAVGGWLDITRDDVSFRADDACFVDHLHFTRAPTVAQALRLWRGEFLDGVCFGDAPAFTGWLDAERHRVRLLLRELLVRTAANEPSPTVSTATIVRLARIVAALDPFDEEAHRLLMVSLARAGNRAAALTCYEDLRRRLAAELGVEPASETRAVRRELAPRPAPARRAPLPVPGTDLIGRDADVLRLQRLLARERLVTLLGQGGIGKTRLAIAAADGCQEVAFVSFAGVRPEAAVTTLARRLDVDLSPPRPALELLLAALTRRRVLLVLDNLEHVPAFDMVIAEILRTAADVRVLATSRRRLDLPGQTVVPVRALPAPAAEALFAARAVRAQPAFDPDRDAAMVAAICAATGGLPLAIELAASLLRAIPCADLAQRLGVTTGLLSTACPSARSRHASMRTVFETSWELLDPAGRQALAALSVFGGGCTLRSALEVARTSPPTLVRLVDHSVLHLTPSGRYALHPLIQQFAAAHLAEDRRTRQSVRARHAAHFARLLDRHANALQDGSDTEVTGVLGAEMDNVRLAWAASGEPRFLDRYWALCLRLRLYEESGAIVRRHLARTPESPWLRARWSRMAGVSAYQLAREPEATRLARAALDALGEPLPHSPGRLRTAMLTAAARQLTHRLAPIAARPATRRLLPPALQALRHLLPAAGRRVLRGLVPSADRRVLRGLGTSAGRRGLRGLVPSRRDPAGCGEAAQALSLLARLAYHQQDLPTMLAASLRQLNAAERAGEPALRAEAYANFATIARLAGRHRLATRYGTLADRALAAIEQSGDAARANRTPAGDATHPSWPPAADATRAERTCERSGDARRASEVGEHSGDAANRALLSRGLDQLGAGAFEAARRSFGEGRARTLDPRMAENCAGLLAETALWQGDFAGAVELFATTEELAVTRVGDDIGRYWCLTGQAEALLRMDEVPAERIRRVLAAARLSTERRRTHEEELGLRDGPALRVTQEMRLLTASARLSLRTPETPTTPDPVAALASQDPIGCEAQEQAWAVLGRVLALAEELPSVQPGMLECWSGLAELFGQLSPRPGKPAARTLLACLSKYAARNPGAAARIGWARALVLAATGRRRAARRTAEQARAAAERLAVPYDRRRADELARHLAKPTRRTGPAEPG